MAEPLRIALAGLGTVGTGVIRLIETNAELIARRAGRQVQIVAVSARERGKDRGVDIAHYDWEDDPVAIARRDDVDVMVELMGGSDGPAKACVETALAQSVEDVFRARWPLERGDEFPAGQFRLWKMQAVLFAEEGFHA